MNAKILQSGLEEKIPAGIVLTGGSSILEGVIDLAEEVFHKQVIGVPQHIFGGSAEIVKNPEYAEAVCFCTQKNKINLKLNN